MRRFALAFLVIFPTVVAPSGCRQVGDALTRPAAGRWGSPSPLAGRERSLASPSGTYMLDYVEKPSPRVLVQTSSGATLATLRLADLPDMAEVTWSPGGRRFAFIVGGKEKGGLYVFTIEDRSYRRVLAGDVGYLAWSGDGRYLACLDGGGVSDGLPDRVRTGRGSLVLLEASRSYARAFAIGSLAGPYAFSQDGTRIAFSELEKDEHGDLARHVLRVAESGSGRASRLLDDRRRIEWIWAGDDALTVTTHDRYAVPTLSLVDLRGERSVLVTSADLTFIVPRQFDAETGRVLYEPLGGLWRGPAGELWAVRRGGRPERLPADDPAYARLRADREPATPAGAPPDEGTR